MVVGTGVRPTGMSLGRLADLAQERTSGAGELRFEGGCQSYGEIAARARRLSAGLRGAVGLTAGSRVAVCMANCPEVSVAYHAVWRAGGVVTPVLFLVSADELRRVLQDSEACCVVTTPEFLDKVRTAARGLPAIRAIVCAGRGPTDQPGPVEPVEPVEPVPPVLDFADLEVGEEGDLVEVDPAGMAALLYTGGTTGRARGVVLSHEGLSAGAWAAASGTADDGRVSLLPLPMSHVYGLTLSVMSLHADHPGTAVLMRWFDPVAWLDLVAEHGVNISALVPSMAQQLLGQPLHDHELSTLWRVASGGSPLPRETALEWRRRLPGVELVDGYGCTESSAIIATSPVGRARLGSVGVPAPGVEVLIEAPGGGEVARGQDGEICVRGPMLMTEYWQAPEATAQALRDGWLHTGDIGHLDEDGYLYVIDRIKDLIIRGGVNVYPRDVEDGMLAHPEVAQCGVVGRSDARHGEEVVAFVELAPGATVAPEELVRWGRRQLGPIRYPREVHVVEALPLTSTLKIDRRALRALLT